MSRDLPQLPRETHAEILERRILTSPDYTEATPSERPRAVILAGQPGSGKGGLVASAQAEFGGNVVVVDPDELRVHHPDLRALQTQHPYDWSSHTHADASRWADELREATVADRKNLILDSTLSNGEWTSEMINDLKAKGYEVEVRAVVAHKLESEYGVESRYAQKLDASGAGRYVPQGARDAIYDKVPSSLDTVVERTGVQVRLYSREGVELYDSRTSTLRPGEALIAEREARMRDPAIVERTRQGWAAQQEWHRDLPENLARNPRVTEETAKRLLEQRAELKVVDGVERNVAAIGEVAESRGVVGAVRAGPTLGRSVAGGAAALGVAMTVADGIDSGNRQSALYDMGNATGARSELIHFGSRTVGAWGGAALGAGVGAAGTSWSGPGAVIGGIVGGAAGLVGGQYVADYLDHRSIYRQTDAQGYTYAFDPEKPALGWRRTETIDQPMANGQIVEQRREVVAGSSLASQLDRQATTVSLDLMLARPPVPRDPYSLPAGPGDASSARETPWERDPASGEWRRELYTLQATPRGPIPAPAGIVTADPERAAQLEAASQAILRENVHLTPAAMAARYELAYHDRGWAQHGALPESARTALANDGRLVASDGAEYQRQADGRWERQALFGLTTADANPRVAAELDATRGLLQEGLREHRAMMAERPQPAPPTHEEIMSGSVARAYARQNLQPSAEAIDTMGRAMAADYTARGLNAPYMLQLERDPVTKQYGPDSPVGLYTRDADGDMSLRFTMTPAEAREVLAAPTRAPVAPAPTAPTAPEATPEPATPPVAPTRADAAPRDPLNEAMRDFVHAMDRSLGRTPDEASDRVAAALTAQWRANGLTTPPSGVVLGQKGTQAAAGEHVFAYSGSPERPNDFVGVRTAEAVQTPVDQSLARAETLQRQQALEAQQVALAQQQASEGPRMTMG